MKKILAIMLLITTPAAAFDINSMSDSEKTAFGQAVREYLMANPEVLIESINVLEERQVANAAANDKDLVATNQDKIFDDGHSWVGGNPDGDMTVVEFIDYRCGVCRQVNDEVREIVKQDGNIRLIIKEFPILGQDSDASSRFAIAVHQIAGDDTYMQAHDALIALRSPATNEALRKIADKIGVDADEVINRMHTEDVTAVLRENHQLAEQMAIRGTPTFVIGDELLRGVPRQGLAATVEEIRQAKSEG